jgi:phosphomannomutase
VGEANVTEVMRRVGAVIGGEGNGGVIYPRINFGRDSLVGMALILHHLAAAGRPVSALVADYPALHMVKRQLACPSHRIAEVLRQVRTAYADRPIDTRDGVKVTTPSGWFLLRGSNTEPIMRLAAEGPSRMATTALADKVQREIEEWLTG